MPEFCPRTSRPAIFTLARKRLPAKVLLVRWIRDGKLSAMKLPSCHFRVSVTDFKEFLERHHMPVAPELADY
jgi:hypothetical protein